MREIRVSGETDDEYTKGAKTGGTINTTTTVTGTSEGATGNTRRIQQLEAELKEAETSAAQVWYLLNEAFYLPLLCMN